MQPVDYLRTITPDDPAERHLLAQAIAGLMERDDMRRERAVPVALLVAVCGLFATGAAAAVWGVWTHPTRADVLLGMFAFPGLFAALGVLFSRERKAH